MLSMFIWVCLINKKLRVFREIVCVKVIVLMAVTMEVRCNIAKHHAVINVLQN